MQQNTKLEEEIYIKLYDMKLYGMFYNFQKPGQIKISEYHVPVDFFLYFEGNQKINIAKGTTDPGIDCFDQ